MAYEIRYEKEGRGVVVKLSGIISAQEIFNANTCIYSGREKLPLQYQIWDFTEATKLDLTGEQLRHIAMQDGHALPSNPGMVVALAGSQELFTGKERIYKIASGVWAEGMRVEIFPELKKARAWIDSIL